MRMLFSLVDAACAEDVKADLAACRAPGYTVMPVLEGAGHTGVHAGNRVHPGTVVAVLVMGEDAEIDRILDYLVARRDARHDSITRMFVLPLDRVA